MAADVSYTSDIMKWREEMEIRLKSDDGWLTITGLNWLEQGDTRFGSDPSSAIVLPEGYPKLAGIFRMINDRVQVIPMQNVALLVNEEPVLNASLLNPDTDGKPDQVNMGDITMYVIKRGDRLGIRTKDKNSKIRREFTHRSWFPVDPKYRVDARYTPYAKPVQRVIPTVLDGVVEEQEAVGAVDFTLNGHALKLEAIKSDNQLWFVFRDQTANKQTYGTARFLYAALPKNGHTVLDFNKAYNPPCAFNPYTTCPLPVKQNILPLEIPAGELKYDH